MRFILAMETDQTLSADDISEIGAKAMRAITEPGGHVFVAPRMLVELAPNYLEIPIRTDRGTVARKA